MNAAQKTVLLGFFLALFAVLLFPPFQQTNQGVKLMYGGELGHHFRWPRPRPTGEKSWLENVPASECTVGIEYGVVLRQIGIVIAMAAVLLLAFRKWPLSPVAKELAFTSLALALSLPVPPPDGISAFFWVISAPISPFRDNGHLGPWFVPMVAVASLAGYFVATLLLLATTVWFSRRLAHTAKSSSC